MSKLSEFSTRAVAVIIRADLATRWPAIRYTEEGKAVIERLWTETMQKLDFVRASNIVEKMKIR